MQAKAGIPCQTSEVLQAVETLALLTRWLRLHNGDGRTWGVQGADWRPEG